MDGIWMHVGAVFMGFFAIMNPIANVPIFLGLTSEYDEKTTRLIAFRALIIAFVIISLFAISGQFIFHLFGISLSAFRITGGLLVFLIGFHMLQGNQSSVHHDKDKPEDESLEAKLSVAVSPLALPILAGPGTIATAMNYTAAGGAPELISTIGSFGVLCVITYVFFIFGGRLVSYLGSAALGAITRMMGLILAVIGTQMAVEGLQGAFKVLG
ncbi:MarC family protein [Shewanella sp. 10N.261.52.F9]|mgnify:CR=1 FL=1|uniref:MarC family protein n=1 Tax=Shewanella TaxID=22 RepID=UPI00200BA435|nr:MarC family protein [Shewanella marinintestina]MCL1146011.1 MarC family protein [Shewanella marinintestina]